MGGTNKDGMSRADKNKMNRANKGKIDGANKGGIGGANKSKATGANIKIDKKASIEVIGSTDNSIDNRDKVTNWRIDLIGLVFAALAAADYARNSNLATHKKTASNTTISTLDKFFAIFATLANTIFKRESKVCKSNLFLFAANH